MFCPSCGKEVPDKSAFCLHCGKAIETKTKPRQTAATKWEYAYFTWDWKVNEGGRFPLGIGQNEQMIRLNNWGRHQSNILPALQEWLDNGWEPITEVGPMAYVYRRYKDYLSVAAFRVKLRKPRTSPLPPNHSKLIGRWQVVDVQAKGIFQLATGLAGLLGTRPKEYQFSEDNTYVLAGGNRNLSGVYSFTDDETIQMIPDPPTIETGSFTVRWNANELWLHWLGKGLSDVRLKKIK